MQPQYLHRIPLPPTYQQHSYDPPGNPPLATTLYSHFITFEEVCELGRSSFQSMNFYATASSHWRKEGPIKQKDEITKNYGCAKLAK